MKVHPKYMAPRSFEGQVILSTPPAGLLTIANQDTPERPRAEYLAEAVLVVVVQCESQQENIGGESAEE